MASAMLQRMGLTLEAASEITSAQGQGLITLDDFAQMDKDGIKMLFYSLARPGGTDAAGNRNPGTKVSAQAQINFGLMCYYIAHRSLRVDRNVTFAAVTLVAVKKMKPQQQLEANVKDPTTAPTVDFKNWPKTMENLEQYFRQHRGVDGGPLNYCIRRDLFPEAAAGDPTYNTADSKYNNHDDEIIGRHRIVDASSATGTLQSHEKNGPFVDVFLTDRTRVWELLSEIMNETDAATVIKAFKNKQDGRGAWLALWNHYLGEHNVDHMAAEAEKTLVTTSYTSEGRNWTFDKYALTHLKAHGILESLMEYGYTGIDKRTKVRHLMDGIKTKTLESVKTRIMSDADLRSDFTGCVTLFKDFIRQMAPEPGGGRNISAVGTGTAVDDRYAPDAEWKALSQEQRDAIYKARAERRANGGGGGGGGKGGRGGKNPTKTPTKHKTRQSKIAKLVAKAVNRRIASMAKEKAKDDDEEDEVEEEMNDVKDSHKMRQSSKKKKSGN